MITTKRPSLPFRGSLTQFFSLDLHSVSLLRVKLYELSVLEKVNTCMLVLIYFVLVKLSTLYLYFFLVFDAVG